MEKEFAIISLLERKEERSSKKWKKYLPEAWYKRLLLQKLSVVKKEIEIGKEKGVHIQLPFTKVEAKKYGWEYVERYLEKVAQSYDLEAYFLDKEIRGCISYSVTYCDWLLRYLLFEAIFEKIVKDYQMDCKTLKVVLIDSGDDRTIYILELLLGRLNHFILLTKRKEHFSNLVEKIYETEGLMIELRGRPLKEEMEGDIIIDMSKDAYKEYNYVKERGVILCMEKDRNTIGYLYNRKRNLKIIYDIVYTIQEEYMEDELASVILRRKNWRLNQFAQNGFGQMGALEVKSLCDLYDIELKELKVL